MVAGALVDMYQVAFKLLPADQERVRHLCSTAMHIGCLVMDRAAAGSFQAIA